MLKQENRLRIKKDFNNIFKKGKSAAGGFIFLKFFKNDLSVSRFSFIVSSKISKKAVIRNKVKRRLREIIRNNIAKIKPRFDVIIMPKPAITNKDFQETKKELEGLLKRIKLL